MLKILFILMFPFSLKAQTVPNGANLIKVKSVAFIQICNFLLDSGYTIEKKDDELQTIKTEMKEYEKSFNGAFYIQIRIKDSVAFIRGYFTAPWWDPFTSASKKTDPLFKNDLAVYSSNKKGKFRNNLSSYPFMRMIELFKGLNTDIEYIKE